MNNETPFSQTSFSGYQENDRGNLERNPIGPPTSPGSSFNYDAFDMWPIQTAGNTPIPNSVDDTVINGSIQGPPAERYNFFSNYSFTSGVRVPWPPNNDDLILVHDNPRGSRSVAPVNNTETPFLFGDNQQHIPTQPVSSIQFSEANATQRSSNGGTRTDQLPVDTRTEFRSIRHRVREEPRQTQIGAPIQKKHEKEHQCRYAQCSETFATAYIRNRHECCHDSTKPYVCSVCGKRFSRKDTKQRHERTVSCHEQSQEAQERNRHITSFRYRQC